MTGKVLRCAVYTRKSTEDGLEQEFNSLDAQYEACAAYALSQKHEGWELVGKHYDDGGFSGGTMERPGLARLLGDVEAGFVDVILVYKIDRLTRSLADFARIVDVLDKRSASFVSITQAFNTTTSMGRLTLNVLLSFAQFEREVTAERIRDKIAASKKKGLWMGGPVPLGYDVLDRRLVVNGAEADLVRLIMARYLELGSVPKLVAWLQDEGYTTKVQHRASGPHRGGCKFTRGTLYHLLANRIYLGELSHKGEHFAGEHEAIVSQDLFDEVQAMLRTNSSGSSRRIRAAATSLLTGLMFDGEGRAMTPSHAKRNGKRYRYYVTRADLVGETPAWRVPADDLEQMLCQQLAARLSDKGFLLDLAGERPASVIQSMLRKADLAAATLRSGAHQDRADMITRLVERINLVDVGVRLTVAAGALRTMLGMDRDRAASAAITLDLSAQKVRRGHQLRLVVLGKDENGACRQRNEDAGLVRLMARAQAVRTRLSRPRDGNSDEHPNEVHQLAALGCLAPDIVAAIVEGRQPRGLTARSLMAAEVPVKWDEQRALLGFAS
jgi:site-specific DNA recombinase